MCMHGGMYVCTYVCVCLCVYVCCMYIYGKSWKGRLRADRGGRGIPGVCNNRLCGTWNCIVFGGLIPSRNPSSSSSLSLSLSHTPVFVVFFGRSFARLPAGVSTLTPGVRGGRRCGEEKISLCSSGAGTGGLDMGLVLSLYFPLLVLGVCAVWWTERCWACGVACRR